MSNDDNVKNIYNSVLFENCSFPNPTFLTYVDQRTGSPAQSAPKPEDYDDAEDVEESQPCPKRRGQQEKSLLLDHIDETAVANAVSDFCKKTFDAEKKKFILGANKTECKIADTLASLLFALERLGLCVTPLSATSLVRFLKEKCDLDFDSELANVKSRITKLNKLTGSNPKPFHQLQASDFTTSPPYGAMKKGDFHLLQFIYNRILDSLEGKNFKKEGR